MAFPYALHLVSLRHSQEFSHLLLRYKQKLQRGTSSFGNAIQCFRKWKSPGLGCDWHDCIACSILSLAELQICCISAHTGIKQCHTMNTANHVYFLKACMNVIAALKPILFCEDQCIQWLWFQTRVDFFRLSMKFPRESHRDAHLHQYKAKQNQYSYSFSDFSKFGTFTIRAITQCYRSTYLP